MDPTPPIAAGKLPGWAKKLVPALGSARAIFYYFHGRDFSEIIRARGQANLDLAVVALALPRLEFWLCEAADG